MLRDGNNSKVMGQALTLYGDNYMHQKKFAYYDENLELSTYVDNYFI